MMKYCIQCTDKLSRVVGCFGYNEEKYLKEKAKGLVWFEAITPVFPDLGEFFRWAKENGIKYTH